MRILLVEDDALIGDGIVRGLGKSGMTVDWLRDGTAGRNAPDAAPYDAAVLDLGLPGTDGMDVLAHWRRQARTLPVLILTARDTLENRVAGLNSGADDYLVKPFALSELTARLHALVRRSRGICRPLVEFGALSLDTAAQTAALHGTPLDLTAREYTLLELLVTHKGRILSRAAIEEKLYGWNQEVESNAVEVHIHHLRKKIGNGVILTRRGLGYTLGDAP